MSKTELQTGDECPNCGNSVHALALALVCGDCGWDDRAETESEAEGSE